MLEHVVVIALILGAGYFIVRPLINPAPPGDSSSPKSDDILNQLALKKARVYATIRELEFDLNMGKISMEDFETLKGQYMLDAVDSLKKIDELQSTKTRETGLTGKDMENGIEREISSLRLNRSIKRTNVFCVHCGAKAPYRAQFCSLCGTELVKPCVDMKVREEEAVR